MAGTAAAAAAPWGIGPAHAADPIVFTPSVIADLQQGADAVATGNLNGDARPDVVVSSRQAQKVNVFLNGTSGYTRTAYDATKGVENITIGDVDNDGDNDFVTSDAVAFFDQPARSIVVYTNNGAGSFSASDAYFYEAVAGDVAIADVTGSSTPELVVSDYYGAEVQVLTRGSGGTYSLGAAYSVGAYPYGIVVADLTGDRIPDIATANRESNDATILEGQSGGGYTRTDVELGSSANDIAAADVDGDSALELVVLSQGQGGEVDVLDRVSGTWGATALETSGPSGDLATADVDGDGATEIVTVGFNNLYVWKYTSGTYTRTQSTFGDPESPIYAHSIAPADLDRDGDVDLAASFSGAQTAFGSLVNGSSVPNSDPVPTFTVTASGGARVGTTRTASTSLDGDSSITLAYQWQRAGRGGTWVDIDEPGSRTKEFLLPPSVQNVNVRVQVTATRGASTRTKASAPLQILSGNHNASNPRIEGDREVGGELTAVYDDAVEPAGLRVTYNWTIGGNEIRLTGRTITVPRKARGKKVIVDIRLTAPGYHNQEFRSPAIRIRD